MRAKAIRFYPNPDNEDGRRVLDYLRYSGVSYTKAVTEAILFFLDAREKSSDSDRFLQTVKDTIRESIQGLQLPSPGASAAIVVPDENEEVSMLDFLDELESGATFEEM